MNKLPARPASVGVRRVGMGWQAVLSPAERDEFRRREGPAAAALLLGIKPTRQAAERAAEAVRGRIADRRHRDVRRRR